MKNYQAYLNKKIIKKNIIMITLKERRNNIFCSVTKSIIKTSTFDNALSTISLYKRRNNTNFIKRKDKNIFKISQAYIDKITKQKRAEKYLQTVSREGQTNYFLVKKFFRLRNKNRLFLEKRKELTLQRKFLLNNMSLRKRFFIFLKNFNYIVNRKRKLNKVKDVIAKISSVRKKIPSFNFYKRKLIKLIMKKRLKRIKKRRKLYFFRLKHLLKKNNLLMSKRKRKKISKNLIRNFLKTLSPIFLQKVYKFIKKDINLLLERKEKSANFFKDYLKFYHSFKLFLQNEGLSFSIFIKKVSIFLKKKKRKYSLAKNIKDKNFITLFHRIFIPFYENVYITKAKKYRYYSKFYTTLKIAPTIPQKTNFKQYYNNYYNIKYPIESYIKSKILMYPSINYVPTLRTQSLLKFFTTGTISSFKNRNRKLVAASRKLGARVSYFLSKQKYLNFPIVFVIRSKLSTSF